ncbi:hypothetical protein DIPPA_30707 [Diplonema papillatum]|nr:hypothetical protein DIPPA_30707 [Diplonema papillatum]|eukprot:gene3992-6194_t
MGIIQLAPYNRKVLWIDPRSKCSQQLSRELYQEWKTKRMKKAENVMFDQTALGGVYSVMEKHAGQKKVLTFQSFKDCMTEIGLDEKYHTDLFARFDNNSDGGVDPAEFCESLDRLLVDRNNLTLLRSCFDLFDFDRKGHVSQEDVEYALHCFKARKPQEQQSMPTQQQITVMAKLIRSPGDEESRMLTFNEFVSRCGKDSGIIAAFINHILATMCREQLEMHPL